LSRVEQRAQLFAKFQADLAALDGKESDDDDDDGDGDGDE
jgi:hypothetical protein